MQVFKLSQQELRPGCREIQVEGELDLAVADQLRDLLEQAVAESHSVMLRLDTCQFIDSTGIAVIVQAYKRMAEDGRRLAICAPSNQVMRVLSITGLSENGLVFESVDEALLAPQQAG